jgi:F-type H+-transporting ATPase subunit gamma
MRSMEGALETLKKHLSELGSPQNYICQEEITEETLEILGSGMFYRLKLVVRSLGWLGIVIPTIR